ncbi:MAG: hypothetical protein U5K55_05705 [Aliarcobacter sp.]|nr:hypothetical protein [Aliarcobacter sp.]
MKTFFKIFFLFFLSLNLYSNENYIDSITLTKIKKLVQKEEEIAYAYKKYILEKGKKPTLDDLITNNYLPKGFSKTNSFGEDMSLDTSIPYYLKVSIPDNVDLKTNVFDYYYSNIYRTYTKAPLSIKNDKVEIKLSSKEKFIYTNQDNITTTTTGITNKYYLDNNGILHWYKGGVYQFSLNKDLIVDSSVNIFEADGVTVKPEFKTMISDVFFAGQTILHKNSTTNKADEYLGVADDAILKTSVLATVSKDIGLLQFGKQSGGMIVNGDIYTWGNNSNRITGIDIDKYTNSSGSEINSSTKNPVMTTLVKLKAKVYDDDLADEKDLSKFYTQNYFSSPLRSRFVDLFTNTKNSTCGITTKGELFCGGTTGDNYEFGTNFTHVDSVRNGEMLYRSTFFDGITNKAKKLFAINQLWLILSQDGYIYRWGIEDTFRNGFSGNGNDFFNKDTVTTITTTTQVCEKVCSKDECRKWKDVTNTQRSIMYQMILK